MSVCESKCRRCVNAQGFAAFSVNGDYAASQKVDGCLIQTWSGAALRANHNVHNSIKQLLAQKRGSSWSCRGDAAGDFIRRAEYILVATKANVGKNCSTCSFSLCGVATLILGSGGTLHVDVVCDNNNNIGPQLLLKAQTIAENAGLNMVKLHS